MPEYMKIIFVLPSLGCFLASVIISSPKFLTDRLNIVGTVLILIKIKDFHVRLEMSTTIGIKLDYD